MQPRVVTEGVNKSQELDPIIGQRMTELDQAVAIAETSGIGYQQEAPVTPSSIATDPEFALAA